jgi:copper homeostasis protein
MGCERVLTSGQQPAAPEGMDLIAALNQVAGNRIIIMPGSGVRKENIKTIADRTGCTEFHSSLRRKTASLMEFVHPAFAGSEESYSNNFIDTNDVISLRKAFTT